MVGKVQVLVTNINYISLDIIGIILLIHSKRLYMCSVHSSSVDLLIHLETM